MRATISQANTWLTEQIDQDNGQLQFVLAPDHHRKCFLMHRFVELARIHQHDDLALIHRMEVLLRRKIFYRVSIQEGSFLDLLRAGLFSVIREHKELIPPEFPEEYTHDFSLLQFDHIRALEFANSLHDEQDRQNYYQGPLKKMLSPQNTTFEHLRSSREMYAYRRFVSLLPPGDTKTYFQEDLFFQRIKWNNEDLEVHCVYDLDCLPQEHIESLYIAATINLALRGKNSRAHDFLRQISSIERQEELGVFLSRLTSSREAPIEEELDPRDFQVDFPLKTLSEKESLEMAQQLGALHEPYVARRFRSREGIAPTLNVFLDKLALCDWSSVRRVIDTCYGRQAHKFREEQTFLFTELSRKSPVILFEAVRWAVRYQSEEAFLEKTLPHLNASSMEFPIQYKAVSWLFRKHCKSYGFGLLYARLFDLLRKSEDTRDKLEEVLKAHPFLDDHDIPSLLKSLQACPIVNFLEDLIYRDSQMTFNQVYRQLLLHLDDHAPAFHRFLFQRHPQLQFLPERYYDLDSDLLLPI